MGATRTNNIPRQANWYEQADGDHTSLRTDPDGAERLTGIYGSVSADDATMVVTASGDSSAKHFVLLSDQVSDVAGEAGRTLADAEGLSAPGESGGVVIPALLIRFASKGSQTQGWPDFGRTTALNVAHYCVSMNSIAPDQRTYEQVEEMP